MLSSKKPESWDMGRHQPINKSLVSPAAKFVHVIDETWFMIRTSCQSAATTTDDEAK